MPATAPSVLVTDERQRPMKGMEVHAVERATERILARATTGLDGIAHFGPLDDASEYWFRPLGSRNQGGADGNYGHLRVSVLPNADSNTAPPASFMDAGDDILVTTYLVFKTRPQQVLADTESSVITIQRRDVSDHALTTGALTVHLYSTSPGGVFRASPGGSPITSVIIPDGQSTKNFYYIDDTAGNPVLTASTEVLT